MSQRLQERQLVLSESFNGKLDSILANQQALNEQNHELRRQNEALQSALNKQDSQPSRKKRAGSRPSVTVPPLLSACFKKFYKLLVRRNVIQEFVLSENPSSERNAAIFEVIKKELREENGGENCPWSNLEMEAQFLRYFKTRKERETRVQKGQNDAHKKKGKQLRRINAKLERRLIAFDKLKDSLEEMAVKKAESVLFKAYMSSEESEYEMEEENGQQVSRLKCYRVTRLPWERSRLRNIKNELDEVYKNTLSSHAKGMVKPRGIGQMSSRPAPPGPAWAVRDT